MGTFLGSTFSKASKMAFVQMLKKTFSFYTFFWIRILNVDPDPATPILSIIFSSVADPDPGSLCDPCTRIWDPQQ